jgi:general secretion pathway protein I
MIQPFGARSASAPDGAFMLQTRATELRRSRPRSARFVPFLHEKQAAAARAAGEGPRAAGIDGECESTLRGDASALRVNATYQGAEARRFSCKLPSGQKGETRSVPPFCHGFTLVEILVALAIVAIALTAGMRALAQATDTATALKARTLALWVAQNRLAAAQIATPWPALGSYSGEATQAGAGFVWQASVGSTPNPAFRRIEITVAEPQAPDYVLARLVGFLGNTEPRP